MKAYQAWQRDRTCTRKRPYHCQLDANQAILEAAADGRAALASYRCRYCQLIHLTSDLSETREVAA